MITYEEQLDANLDWALTEGSMHFENNNAVHKTLRKITQRLEEIGVPYAVVGGMAMFFHGYRRFTEDVDLLVTPEGLVEIHRRLEDSGYVAGQSGKKQLRDAEFGVRVDFLVTGGYPGDGKPKSVSFPDPLACREEIDGVQCLTLSKLIELKLASGISNKGRLKDLGDAQEMIRSLVLDEELVEQLDPLVQPIYLELFREVRDASPEP